MFYFGPWDKIKDRFLKGVEIFGRKKRSNGLSYKSSSFSR